MATNETLFLRESNAIEDVFDEESLSQAAWAWAYLKGQKELNIGVILKTHKILMLNQGLRPNERGYFRQRRVYIGGRSALHYSDIRPALKVWVQEANADPANWKNMHRLYEEIHPFVDGNGRTGRMFMNWQRLQAKLPILVITRAERNKYYEWFTHKESN